MLESNVRAVTRLAAVTATSGDLSAHHLPPVTSGWSASPRSGGCRQDVGRQLSVGQRQERMHVRDTARMSVGPAPAGEAHAAQGPAPLEPSTGDSARRVLVVEDNRDGLETLLALLGILGYEVAGAADGGEALEQARRFRPHVVLLDLGLPVMDGLQVARTLRKDETFADVYIAALTGWGAEGDRRRTAEAGFNAHLTKPVDLAALEDVLARATSREA